MLRCSASNASRTAASGAINVVDDNAAAGLANMRRRLLTRVSGPTCDIEHDHVGLEALEPRLGGKGAMTKQRVLPREERGLAGERVTPRSHRGQDRSCAGRYVFAPRSSTGRNEYRP